MRYASAQIVFQEVPDEISVAFLVAGCPLRCPGCHSSDAWSPRRGNELTPAVIDDWILRAKGTLSCVLFLGGEWDLPELKILIRHARAKGLKTCLYTGLEFDQVDPEMVRDLDFIKTGSYRSDLGGLNSFRTNQRFIDLATGKNLNHRFQRQQQGEVYDQADGTADKRENAIHHKLHARPKRGGRLEAGRERQRDDEEHRDP